MDDLSRKSTAELVVEVADDLRMLVRKELELARTELVSGVKAQLRGAGLVALAVVAALPGLLFLVVALAMWLPDVLPVSEAAGFAIVAGLLLLFTGAGVAIGVGTMRRRRPGVSTAVDQMKEDVRWAKDRLTR